MAWGNIEGLRTGCVNYRTPSRTAGDIKVTVADGSLGHLQRVNYLASAVRRGVDPILILSGLYR